MKPNDTHGVAPSPATIRWADMPGPLQDALLAYQERPCDVEAASIVHAVLDAYGVKLLDGAP